MRIGAPEPFETEDQVGVRFRVDSSTGPTALWFSVERQFADLLSDASDAALVALLVPAMAQGGEIHLEGAISERLWYSLASPYQGLLLRVSPGLHQVRILPRDVRREAGHAPGVATAFSGGIDSFCVLADYHFAERPAALRLTHLLFNNVGSHGTPGEQLFQERFARLKPTADEIGLPFVRVSSNLDAFYHKPYGFLETHVVRNAAVPFLLQRGIGRSLYASGYSFEAANAQPTGMIGQSETMGLPMLCTETLELLSVGAHYTRVEKTLRVADLPVSYRSLDVCVGGKAAGNCAACYKCVRALLTFEMAGITDRYAAIFDLAQYRRRRTKAAGKVLRSDDPFDLELRRFAVERGFQFPLAAYLLAPVAALRHLGALAARRRAAT